MNKNIAKYFLALATVAIASVGCEVNDYNDKLDGFEGNPPQEVVQKTTYTFTAKDYTDIAGDKDIKALAEATGPEAVAALKAIGTNKFFNEAYSRLFLPPYIAKMFYYLDNGSAVKVSFAHQTQESEIIPAALKNQYELESEDYDGAWGNNNDTPFFTKEKPAEEFLPAVLKAKVKDVVVGDYAIATYSFSNTEPAPAPTSLSARNSAPATRAVTVKKIADINFANKEVATAEGTVIGLHAQGVMIKDDTGIAFLYNGSETFFALGDVIQVSGATELRYGVNQFSRGGTATYISHPAGEFAYPAIAADITKDNIKSYNNVCTHVSMTGTLKVDGNFLNIIIDGMPETEFRGSISYVFPAADIKSYDAKQITVTGYYMGNSGSTTKNFTMLLTSVKLATDGVDVTATGVATTQTGAYTCKGIVVGTYDKGFLLNDGTGVITVLQGKTSTMALNDYVQVKGNTKPNFGMGQFTSTGLEITKLSTMTPTYPTPIEMTAAEIATYMVTPTYRYATFTGKLSKSSGGYYEVHNIDGAENYGSFSSPLASQKTVLDKLVNKTIKVTGYLIGSNAKTGYFSVMFGSVEQIISFETETRYAVYTYDGAAWTAADSKTAITINEADYKAMGLQNNYFDKNHPADQYVPSFLQMHYPYAQPSELVSVFFNYNETDSYAMGASYRYTNGAWVHGNVTEQYTRKNANWSFSPNVEIYLPATRNDETSLAFYKPIVKYVGEKYANDYLQINPKGGYYDNAEYYYGVTYYIPEIDLTLNKWRSNCDKGKTEYAAMSDDELRALQLKRMPDAFIPALKANYPDAKVSSDYDAFYVITFATFDQAADPQMRYKTITYKLIGNAEWEYVSIEDTDM